jgi:hypothetical protein
MNVGILTYHAVNNFGALLQAISTCGFLKKNGYTPIIINWIPNDLEIYIQKETEPEQWYEFEKFRNEYFLLTRLCRTGKDIADVIEKLKISAVVIGSDAVVQYYPFRNQIIFPSRKILSIKKVLTDKIFPNPFFGDFIQYLNIDIPVILMSVSGQGCPYRMIVGKKKQDMNKQLKKFKYISVRDIWTKKMFEYISDKYFSPVITPDPVFAFNNNFYGVEISKKEIIEKFGLSENYILFSFHNSFTVSKEWLNSFEELASKDGYSSVALKTPTGINFTHPFSHVIDVPLSPVDWYFLIKYSSGYIGHNMHPIIVCLHNNVPFFSFDQYSKRLFFIFSNKKASKIYHILSTAGLQENRISSISFTLRKKISASMVYESIIKFDRKKCVSFAKEMYNGYLGMASDILLLLK